jgi:putative nucleotidyltransferase with HDIG domain
VNIKGLKTWISEKMGLRRKAEKEPYSGSGAKSPDLERRNWFILFSVSVVISILLFPHALTSPRVYAPGDVVERDIKAAQEFLVEDPDLTEKSRQEASRAVLPVFDFDPEGTNVVSRIKESFRLGREYLSKQVAPAGVVEPGKTKDVQGASRDLFRGELFETLGVPEDEKLFNLLVKTGFSAEVEETAALLLVNCLRTGVVADEPLLKTEGVKGILLRDIRNEKETKNLETNVFFNVNSAKTFVREQGKKIARSLSSSDVAEASYGLAAAVLQPNITFNKRETELRRDQARKDVKPFYFIVKKGEMLVREGERITAEHLVRLNEHNKILKRKEMLTGAPAMALLISLLLSSLYLVGLLKSKFSRAGATDLLLFAVTLVCLFLVIMAAGFVADEVARGISLFTSRALIFAMPVASGAMVIAVFNGMKVAASFSLIASILSALVIGGRVEWFIYFFISSLMSAYGVKDCRERVIIIKTGLKVGGINVVMALAIQALDGTISSPETAVVCASGFVGGILVGIITTGLLPLIEMTFGYTTDIKLLEQANLDQPLLRELMVQAPGTYHHSVIVSTMVEAAAKGIKANPLMAKVAAYYHDIGKVKKPMYFVENQMGGDNKHERLAPSMSSLILISHVKEGVELAKKYRLGREICDIIRQHHGTNLISFFYERAKEQAEKKGDKAGKVKEQDFRYPGPKPQTKEAGLVMLADAAEAASRTISEPSVARIQGLVQKIINKAFSDGQLDECELTLKDLNEIARSFNKTLGGIFHQRIEYPQPVLKIAPVKRGAGGNPDTVQAEEPKGKRREDKDENGDTLKRLGLS